MRKRYGRLLVLWSLAVLLMAGLLSGCGAGTQNDRKRSSAAVNETEGAVQTAGGEAEGTVQTAGGETEGTAQRIGGGTDQSIRSADSETAPEAGKGKGETVSEDGGSGDGAALPEEDGLPEDGSYTSKEDVALYLHTYGHLPDNFIRKNDAKQLGWDNSKGNLAEVAPDKSIGGDRFGNYEGLLPDEDGRKWTECDIGYEEGYRNGERIVFSNDGLIYYTGDHYKSFERLY